MFTYQTLSDTLAKSGPLLECRSIVAIPKSSSWRIAFGEDDRLDLAFDDKLGLIHMSADIAPCPEEPDPDLLKSLLAYSEGAVETHGARFGLDGARRWFTLTLSFPADGLYPEALAERIAAVRELHGEWRGSFIEEEEEEPADEAAQQPPSGVDDFVIKV